MLTRPPSCCMWTALVLWSGAAAGAGDFAVVSATAMDTGSNAAAVTVGQSLEAEVRYRVGPIGSLVVASESVAWKASDSALLSLVADGARKREGLVLEQGKLGIRVREGGELHVRTPHLVARVLRGASRIDVRDAGTTVCLASPKTELRLPKSGMSLFLRDAGHCVFVSVTGALRHAELSVASFLDQIPEDGVWVTRSLQPHQPRHIAEPTVASSGNAQKIALERIQRPPERSTAVIALPGAAQPVKADAAPSVGPVRDVLEHNLPATDADGSWHVVVGSYSTRQVALRAMADTGLGERVRMRVLRVDHPATHRVIAGPWRELRDADTARRELRYRYPRAWLLRLVNKEPSPAADG